jgi:hypothetical protein
MDVNILPCPSHCSYWVDIFCSYLGPAVTLQNSTNDVRIMQNDDLTEDLIPSIYEQIDDLIPPIYASQVHVPFYYIQN